MESEVLSTLAACASWGPTPGENQPRRRKALRRAVAYSFRQGLGITPLQVMRRCRLNGAHRDLRSAEPGSTTVATVAMAWGFSQLGRFAVEYRKMFGYRPSETLVQPSTPARSFLL
jgi:transcriptional regulator GlxA family with amidase domain